MVPNAIMIDIIRIMEMTPPVIVLYLGSLLYLKVSVEKNRSTIFINYWIFLQKATFNKFELLLILIFTNIGFHFKMNSIKN